jgi:F-type H+-transporting ATPase subunit b
VLGAEPETPLKKYIGIIHTEKGEEEKIFDVSRPNEAEELHKLFDEGLVEEIKKDREINILAISWDLGLWTVVVFGLLLFFLYKLAWKPMLAGLHRRETNVRDALTNAQKARDDAQRLQAQLQTQMDQAQDKVRQILDEARRHAQESTDDMIGKARQEIQGERERLHREIGMARDQALQQLWAQTAQLATMVSAKAIRRQLTLEDHARFVDEAIADLRQPGEQGNRQLAGI